LKLVQVRLVQLQGHFQTLKHLLGKSGGPIATAFALDNFLLAMDKPVRLADVTLDHF
jgi:hypothetical protein